MEPTVLLGAVVGLLTFFLLSIKISREPFWGVLALVFFLPFERIPTLEIGGFTAKINHLVGGLLILFWLLDLVFNHRKIRSNPTAMPVWLLLSSFALSFLAPSATTRGAAFLGLNIFVILLYLATVGLLDSTEKLAKINKILKLSGWLIVIYGFYQFFGDLAGLPTGLDPGYTKMIFGFPRVQAFSREPLYLGNYLLIPLAIGFSQWLARQTTSNQQQKTNNWSPILLILLSIIFLLTLSRGAYLAAIAAFLILVGFYARKVFTVRNFTAAAVCILTAVVVVAGILTRLGPESKEKFINQVTIKDFGVSESTQGRLNAFGQALDIWRASPWVGVGLGNYGLYTANLNADAPQVQDIVNNQYIELLVETGLIGLAAFLIFILACFWRFAVAWRQADQAVKPWLVGLAAALVGTLVQYNFFSTLAIVHIWVLLGLLVAVEQLATQNVKIKSQKSK